MKKSIFSGVLVVTTFGEAAQWGGGETSGRYFSDVQSQETYGHYMPEAESEISRAQVTAERDEALASHSIATGEFSIPMLAQLEPDSVVTRSEVKQEVMALIQSEEFPSSGEFSEGNTPGDFSKWESQDEGRVPCRGALLRQSAVPDCNGAQWGAAEPFFKSVQRQTL